MNRKLITTALLSLAMSVTPLLLAQDTNSPAPASTNSGSSMFEKVWDMATVGSNYFAAAYTIYSTGTRDLGGGIALGYQATEGIGEVFSPMIRLDYFADQFWMVEASAKFQPPRKLLGKWPAIPFGIVGAAMPFSGAGTDNGTAVAIVGAGVILKLDWVGSGSFWKHADLVAGYERWLGLPSEMEEQIRVGGAIKF